MQNPVRRALVVIIAMLALSFVLAACSGDTETVTQTKTVTKTVAPPQPKYYTANLHPQIGTKFGVVRSGTSRDKDPLSHYSYKCAKGLKTVKIHSIDSADYNGTIIATTSDITSNSYKYKEKGKTKTQTYYVQTLEDLSFSGAASSFLPKLVSLVVSSHDTTYDAYDDAVINLRGLPANTRKIHLATDDFALSGTVSDMRFCVNP